MSRVYSITAITHLHVQSSLKPLNRLLYYISPPRVLALNSTVSYLTTTFYFRGALNSTALHLTTNNGSHACTLHDENEKKKRRVHTSVGPLLLCIKLSQSRLLYIIKSMSERVTKPNEWTDDERRTPCRVGNICSTRRGRTSSPGSERPTTYWSSVSPFPR